MPCFVSTVQCHVWLVQCNAMFGLNSARTFLGIKLQGNAWVEKCKVMFESS
jgi:hypothetical protein